MRYRTRTEYSKTAGVTPEQTAGRLERRTWADNPAGLSPRLITCGSSQERDVWGLAADHQKIRLGVSGVAQGLYRWMRIGVIVWLGNVGI